MTKPVIILDPGHGGSSCCFYDLDNGVRLPYTWEDVGKLQPSQKHYLCEEEHARWKRGERHSEPRFYFERKGRRITHGDPGAWNPLDPRVLEKDLALDLARTMVRLLSRHYVVKSTRDRDGYVATASRARYAGRMMDKHGRPALLVSLHADASDDPDARGFLVYRRPGDDPRLAETFHRALDRHLDELGVAGGRREVVEEPRELLQRAPMPAVLLQLGFLSNPKDAERLLDRHLRNELAQVLGGAVRLYLRRETGAGAEAGETVSARKAGGELYADVQA